MSTIQQDVEKFFADTYGYKFNGVAKLTVYGEDLYDSEILLNEQWFAGPIHIIFQVNSYEEFIKLLLKELKHRNLLSHHNASKFTSIKITEDQL